AHQSPLLRHEDRTPDLPRRDHPRRPQRAAHARARRARRRRCGARRGGAEERRLHLRSRAGRRARVVRRAPRGLRSLLGRLRRGGARMNAVVEFGVEKIEHVGSVVELAKKTIVALIKPPYAIAETIRQMEIIGVRSLPIVVLTAVFSSLVMTV